MLGRLPTVLVIESNPILRNLLRDILSRNKFIVLDAVSTREAVSLLHALPNQCVDLLVAPGETSSASNVQNDVRALRPSMKILLTMSVEQAGQIPNLATIGETPVLYEPFTEARVLAQIAALLRPRIH